VPIFFCKINGKENSNMNRLGALVDWWMR
jgi:hypothetical protein